MATFGGLGGLGGYGRTFPMRYGAPVSDRVASDQEWHQDWQRKIAAIPATAGMTGGEMVTLDLVPGARGYNAGLAARYYKQMGDIEGTAYDPLMKAASKGASHKITGVQWLDGATPAENPAYAQALQDYASDTQQRRENQLRQQQAYDSMRGWNQQNAVIGPDYTNPNFGQVSGQSGPTVPSVPGVDMSWIRGLLGQTGLSGQAATLQTGAAPNWAGLFGGQNLFGGSSQLPQWGL